MLDAFPNEDRVNPANLRQFATAVAGLLHISDFQRRRITHMMRHYRDMRRKYAFNPLALETLSMLGPAHTAGCLANACACDACVPSMCLAQPL